MMNLISKFESISSIINKRKHWPFSYSSSGLNHSRLGGSIDGSSSTSIRRRSQQLSIFRRYFQWILTKYFQSCACNIQLTVALKPPRLCKPSSSQIGCCKINKLVASFRENKSLAVRNIFISPAMLISKIVELGNQKSKSVWRISYAYLTDHGLVLVSGWTIDWTLKMKVEVPFTVNRVRY